MKQFFGFKPQQSSLVNLGLTEVGNEYWNTSVPELVEQVIIRKEGHLVDSGALAVDTGKFTGRSPKDRFIVCDDITSNAIWWGDINIKFTSENFDKLLHDMQDYLKGKDVFVRDAKACASEQFSMNLRVVTELAYQSLFAYNMFIRPSNDELNKFDPEWSIIAAPGFKADPKVHGTRQDNFSIINFTQKMIIIGGSGYTGEIKKGIFSALNFILPHQHKVLSMHCSANVGNEGDTAIFFGLSGTGKTTLSADPERKLIGDDEHGWSENTVFNFEGGCYAKCINLSAEKEPQIHKAIRFGSLLENVRCFEGTNTVDFANDSVTENTRVSYPIEFIDNALIPSVGGFPKNIFFLTADAFGVLPPISKLTKAQAMFNFVSGYTAKVAGTEAGVVEPQATFSACFGKAFMPLHPTQYAELLGKKLEEHNVNVWLINTGWTGGEYGVGSRMSLPHTRAMIKAALNGELNNVEFVKDSVFHLAIPTSCPNVPSEILNPRNTWKDKEEYDKVANHLAQLFIDNFKQFASVASEEMKSALPTVKK
jgi:phosphoenolpyruvate carboxykinase (ATP)